MVKLLISGYVVGKNEKHITVLCKQGYRRFDVKVFDASSYEIGDDFSAELTLIDAENLCGKVEE